MKNKEIIKRQIDEIINSKQPFFKDSEHKKTEKNYNFLKSCLLYLESNPNELFLKNNLEDINKKINKILDNFSFWYNSDNRHKALKNPKQAYNTETGLKQLEAQKKPLNLF